MANDHRMNKMGANVHLCSMKYPYQSKTLIHVAVVNIGASFFLFSLKDKRVSYKSSYFFNSFNRVRGGSHKTPDLPIFIAYCNSILGPMSIVVFQSHWD